MTTLADVKAAQPEWFSPQNKKFFGDIEYRVLHSKKTGEPYLCRATYAWTDMFDRKRKKHWRINTLNEDLTIGGLIDNVFGNLWAVKRWLKEH